MKNTRACSQAGDHADTGCERAYQYLPHIVISQTDEKVVNPNYEWLDRIGDERSNTPLTAWFDQAVQTPLMDPGMNTIDENDR
jgi:hypothetical protein